MRVTQAYLVWQDASGQTKSLQFDNVISESWDENTTITEHPVEKGSDVADNVRVSLSKCNLEIHSTNEPIEANNWVVATPSTAPVNLPGPSQSQFLSNPTVVIKEWENNILAREAAAGIGGFIGSGLGGTTGGIIGNAVGDIVGGFLFAPHEYDVPVQPEAGLTPTPGSNVNAGNWTVTADDYVQRMITQLTLLKGDATAGTTPQLMTLVGTKKSKSNMVIESFNHTRDADTGTGAEITLVLKEIRQVTTQIVAAPVPTKPRAKTPNNKGPQNPQDDSVQAPKTSFMKQIIYSTLGGPPAASSLSPTAAKGVGP